MDFNPKKQGLLYVVLFISGIYGSGFAQERQPLELREFQKEEWRRATQGIDYSEDIVRARKPKQQGNRSNGSQQRPIKLGGNASPVLKALIILLLGVALFFLIRSLLGLNNPKNKAVKPVLSLEELAQLEENLHQADLDDFIQRAVEQGNYALAVRLYYLAILKELSLKNRITWKKDKTNRDYLQEMRFTPMEIPFSEITILFERIWYGNIQLQQWEFEQVEPKFKTFIQKIEIISTPVVQ